MGELSEAAAVRRAYDRLGFGGGGETLAKSQEVGLATVVAELLAPGQADRGAAETPPPDLPRLTRPRGKREQTPDPEAKKSWRQARRTQQLEITQWWLDRMVQTERPATERITWFWHGHFATSNQKVKQADLMLAQNETMRRLGRGNFAALAQAMIVDPAMLVWLDGNDNTAQAPNENLSREFLELFTLGHGHYTEEDVREAARALTGWKLDRPKGTAVLRPRLQDQGAKQILGRSTNFDAASFVAQVLAQPASADFIIARLWFRLVSTTPAPPETVQRLTTAYGQQRNVTALLAAMLIEPAFRDPASSVVKQPVEWLVGLMRAIGVRPTALEPKQQRKLSTLLRGMGQLPFLPPSVGGWPAGGAWLTTAAALSRMEAARLIGTAAEWRGEASQTAEKQRPEYLRRLLGVDEFSDRTVAAISRVAADLPSALAVAACSPEYTVSR
jgi:uncharacterized protein (DUF1800 family)